MKFEAITIKDIAKKLSLSTSTVSRALRDSYEISSETKQMVLDCAEKLNYHPNPIAKSLRDRKSGSIGVIVCEIANSFFSQVINGIESIAYERGYNIIISQSHESYEREVINSKYLASRSVDGMLISLSTETNDLNHLEFLHNKGLPLVFFDRVTNAIPTYQVTVNNYKGAYAATDHLIKNGFKSIATLTNSAYLSITHERLRGYKAALEANDIPVKDSYIRHCFYGGMIFSEIEDALDQLLELKEKPDAIFATSDKLTTGCLKYLNNKGISVPAEIAIVGFSNSELAELVRPSLTVVRQPAFEIGKCAIELLLSLIESKRKITTFDKIILEPELLIRESSMPTNRKLSLL
ncbi:MAG TPA: LacI family DNA-binding transcriptional regulator [Chitinophagaceae bacterium]|nr:LacI family DNA-binding transcriptional regulator [Chitinophagaceae bacterium]